MGSTNPKEGQAGKKEQPAQVKKPKPQPSEASKARAPKQANQDQNQWMYDFILQYLASPMWRNPISDFLDENCIVFDDEEENKISYQDIHKQFKGMIEAMIEQLMADIGVEDEEQLRGVIEIGLRNKRHKKYFEQLLIVDNFLVFKKLMLKRNKELEYEALKELQKQDGGNNPDVQYQLAQVELDKERMEMEHAIAMSLAVDKEKKKLCIEEDEELQEAIRQSEMLFQSQKVEKQIQDNVPSIAKIDKTVVKIEKIDQPVVGQAESVIVFEDDMAEQEPSISIQPQTQFVQQHKEEPKKVEQKVEVVQLEQQPIQQEEPKKQEPKMAPLKPLPQIVQEKKAVTQADKEEMIKQMEQLKKEKQQIDQEFEKNLAEKQQTETVEERKKRLLEQREMLRKKKQQEREKELEKYNQDQGNKNFDQQQPLIEDTVNKDPLTSNMSEFIADQQKAQQLQQKKEELKKKAELMKKIRQQAQEEQQQQ